MRVGGDVQKVAQAQPEVSIFFRTHCCYTALCCISWSTANE
jgi:hypothetical protein